MEGTFKGHPVQPPCNEQGHLPLDGCSKSLVYLSPFFHWLINWVWILYFSYCFKNF